MKHYFSTDVCIIGGGVAGLSTAYFLSQVGISVCIIEKGVLASGQSSRSTSHLTYVLDTRYIDFERQHGRRFAHAIANSHRQAIDKIAAVVKKERIACAFERVNGYRYARQSPSIRELKNDLACFKRLGLKGPRLVAKAPIASFESGPALCVPRQAQCNLDDYVKGLARAVRKKGGQILLHTRVNRVSVQGPERVNIHTPKHIISSRAVVFATFCPPAKHVRSFRKLKPVRSFVIKVRIPKRILKRALYWDTCDPYHYLRLCGSPKSYDVLMLGGEDRTARRNVNSQKAFAGLRRWATTHFPVQRKIDGWSGTILYSADGRAYLGRTRKKNIFVITGDSANGITYATIGALIIRDQITGRKNAWEKLYDPERL